MLKETDLPASTARAFFLWSISLEPTSQGHEDETEQDNGQDSACRVVLETDCTRLEAR